MNQKLCKKLRKLAKGLAQENNYPKHQFTSPKNNVKRIPTSVNEKGETVYSEFQYTGTIKNVANSERGIYLRLKSAK